MSTGNVLLLLGCLFAFATGHWGVGLFLLVFILISAVRL